MFMSKVVTNKSARAWGSIVVGSPSFAQRKVFASAVTLSATINTIMDIAHRHTQPSRFVIARLPATARFE